MNEVPKSAELNPGPGFMIRRTVDRLPPEVAEGLAEFESTDISDVLNRMYAMRADIRNMVNDAELCGPVCTVKTYPGDNLMVHKVLDIARPGDIVVIDASGSMSAAVIGDMISNKARHRGIAGFIVDGLVRDLAGLQECGMPIYARGITPFGPLHRGPGEVNYAVCCGGIVVHPGDIVRADSSGIAVIPRDAAESTLQRLRQNHERLSRYVADVKRGEFSNGWVDAQLARDMCIIHD